MTIRSAASTSPPEGAARKRPALLPMVILALILIVVVLTGVGYAESASAPNSYACMSIAHQGSSEKITSSGLLHYAKSQYFFSCSEGSPLPISQYKASCLTITPKTIPAPIGNGASTVYYYVSGGSTITLNGAPAPSNATEYINPGSISLSVNC